MLSPSQFTVLPKVQKQELLVSIFEQLIDHKNPAEADDIVFMLQATDVFTDATLEKIYAGIAHALIGKNQEDQTAMKAYVHKVHTALEEEASASEEEADTLLESIS